MAKTSKKILEKIPCIHYLVHFQKNWAKIQALIDFESEVNIIIPAFALKLDFKVWSIDIRAQKINSSTFKTFAMSLTSF